MDERSVYPFARLRLAFVDVETGKDGPRSYVASTPSALGRRRWKEEHSEVRCLSERRIVLEQSR